MADCIWVQYEPEGSSTPYPGFINGTVSGMDDNPPPLEPPRLQVSVPLGTVTDGMKVDVARNELVPDVGS